MTPGSGIGVYGAPPDAAAWIAIVAALAALAAAPQARRIGATLAGTPLRAVVVLALGATLLSWLYVVFYLRGGPRIIDATGYFLEGRALATGHPSFEIPWPSGSFRGRFLLAPEAGRRLAVIFPPGWPAALALGFLVKAPLAIGPLVGGALVLATFVLARRLTQRTDAALAAATLSAISATLRYHTADTMAHGWSALLFAVALAASAGRGPGAGLLAGVATGWLVATRPVTGAVAAIFVLLALHGRRERGAFTLGLLPGVALLLWYQRAATGSFLGSTQLAYYALSDGPQGCFRWGFGAGVGCLNEHGDFVRARLPHGFGALEALGTTARRLVLHLRDVANAEPLALLVPAGALLGRSRPALRRLGLAVAGVMLAYAPFYFDGSYPGGGARLYADVLPLEHVLIASALVELRVTRFAWPLALAGFALHTSFEHRALASREGGLPMLEQAVLDGAQVHRGLLFVDTDHGFLLGHQPGELDPSRSLIVARARDDAHDAVLWELLGRPPAWRYTYPFTSATARPGVTPIRLTPPAGTLRFEAEADWPPLRVAGGWVQTAFPGGCASGGRGLALHPTGRTLSFDLELPVPRSGKWHVETRWVATATTSAEAAASVGRVRLEARGPLSAGQCWNGPAGDVDLEAGSARLGIEAGEALLLDATLLTEQSGKR